MQVVDEAKKQLKLEEAKKFGGQARKMPTRIVASGLGQALAFLKAKGYAPMLLIALTDWVLSKPNDGFANNRKKPADDELLKAVILGTADFLRQATDEALAYLQWLNRFCEANKLSDDVEAGNG
jgi:CRISPR-associated protein Cmr5